MRASIPLDGFDQEMRTKVRGVNTYITHLAELVADLAFFDKRGYSPLGFGTRNHILQQLTWAREAVGERADAVRPSLPSIDARIADVLGKNWKEEPR